MARYIFQGTFRDGQGNVVSSGTITVHNAGTSTVSTIYIVDSGGSPVTSVSSDSNGHFFFYIDSSDYGTNVKFDVTLSKDGYTSKTYEDIVIYGQGPTGETGPAGPDGPKITSVAWSTNDMVFTLEDDSTVTLTNAKVDLKGDTGETGTSNDLINNLKPSVNASVNILDIFSKTGGAAPDADDAVIIAIPDGSGYTRRTRNGSYLSGDSTITMADAANYWAKGSLDEEIKTAWLYAIWDGTGIVWALAGYSGFTMVPTTTTATDDDYFLLEASSTYTRSNAHYCVAVAKIRYQYDTADTPDHTIQATVENAPQVIWNPKSDYGFTLTFPTTLTQGADIGLTGILSAVIHQTGGYFVTATAMGTCSAATFNVTSELRVGSPTYASAALKTYTQQHGTTPTGVKTTGMGRIINISSGDTLHFGTGVGSSTGNRTLYGDDYKMGSTLLTFHRID